MSSHEQDLFESLVENITPVEIPTEHLLRYVVMVGDLAIPIVNRRDDRVRAVMSNHAKTHPDKPLKRIRFVKPPSH